MSYWPLVLVLLAIAMAVGPIMMMQPSSRDRYLAKLRQQAAQQGLQLRMSRYGSGSDQSSVAVYSLRMGEDCDLLPWQLLRRGYAHDIHFSGFWDWEKQASLSASQQQALKALTEQLPDDIVGLQASEHAVELWWLERDPQITIEQIQRWLVQLKGIVMV